MILSRLLTRDHSLMIARLVATGLPLVAASSCSAFEVLIDAAPRVPNLQKNGEVGTVRTRLPYSEVDGASFEIHGLPVSW